MSSLPFESTIYKIWMLRYLDVPEAIGTKLVQEFRKRRNVVGKSAKLKSGSPQHIPVVATVNSTSTRTTLVPAGAGRYRLQFNVTLRKAARADVGDVARVGLKLDLASRDLPIPLEFEAAMQRNRVVRREFNALPPGLRVQLLRMLNQAALLRPCISASTAPSRSCWPARCGSRSRSRVRKNPPPVNFPRTSCRNAASALS